MGEFRYKFMVHIQGDPRANTLYDDDGKMILDIEKAKAIADQRFPDKAWIVYNGAEAYPNEKYDEEEEERRINAE